MSSMSERLAAAKAYGQQFLKQVNHSTDQVVKLVFVVGPEDRGTDTDPLDWYQTDGISVDIDDAEEVEQAARLIASKAIRPTEAFILPAGGSIYDKMPELEQIYKMQRGRRQQTNQQQTNQQLRQRYSTWG